MYINGRQVDIQDWLNEVDREVIFTSRRYAKVFVGAPGTTIPTSASPVGDYTTKLVFQTLIHDGLNVVDMVNNRIRIPSGYTKCCVSYNLAWDPNATGWRGCRVKNSVGANYGNVRLLTVGAGATTNNNFVSSWIAIVSGASSAPDTIQVGNYFEFWPAQTSGGDLVCGADLPSWVQVDFD